MRYFSTLRYFIIFLALVCTGCGTALPTVKPYKLDIQQGNVVTSAMLLQLRPGMTKSQVRYVMGTPLIQDSFHGNRWDYAYQMRAGGKIIERRRVILDFENELLKSVRGDVIPAGSGQPQPEESAAQTGTRVVTPYKSPEKKGLIDKLKFWETDEAATTKEKAEKDSEAKVKVNPDLVEQKLDAPAPQDVVAPVSEPKSILAVPIESSMEVEVPVVDMPKAEPASASPSVPPAPESALAPAPVKAQSYESPPTKSADDVRSVKPADVAPVAKPAKVVPPVESKTSPPANDLPDEGEMGYFDKMLEKIGF